MLQSCLRPVYFFVISIMARYSIFNRLSSEVYTKFGMVGGADEKLDKAAAARRK